MPTLAPFSPKPTAQAMAHSQAKSPATWPIVKITAPLNRNVSISTRCGLQRSMAQPTEIAPTGPPIWKQAVTMAASDTEKPPPSFTSVGSQPLNRYTRNSAST
ncbi:hypothetical protein D3C80_1019910 [compost metagenome]